MKKLILRLKKFIINYFIIAHLSLFLIFSLFFVYDFRGDKAPQFLHFWNKDVFRQVWTMFSPDPPTSNLYLYYSCDSEAPLTLFDFSPNFFEQQIGRGRYMHMYRELTTLISAKRRRRENNTFRPIDQPIWDEGLLLMEKGIKAECKRKNKKIGKIRYEFKSVEITKK